MDNCLENPLVPSLKVISLTSELLCHSISNTNEKYCKIPKISPGAYIFQRSFLRGLCTEGNLCLKIDWASLIPGRKFTVFICVTLYLRAISKYKPPGGPIFGGAI